MINTQYHYLLIHIKKCIAAKYNSYKSTNQCIQESNRGCPRITLTIMDCEISHSNRSKLTLGNYLIIIITISQTSWSAIC